MAGAMAFLTLTGLILLALLSGSSLAWHFLGFTAALMAITFISQIGPLKWIIIDRHIPRGPYQAGDSLTITFTIQTRHPWVWPYLHVNDPLLKHAGELGPFTISPASHRKTIIHKQLQKLSRGLYRAAEFTITTTDVLGLTQRSATFKMPDEIMVWPQTVSLEKINLEIPLWNTKPPIQHARRVERTTFRNIREYVPGDSLSYVHWKASAHTGALKVMQFEEQAPRQRLIVLDQAHHFSRSDWELAISAAASIAEHLYRTHQPVGFCYVGQPQASFAPNQNPSSFVDIMNYLSALPYSSQGESVRHKDWENAALVVITTPSQAVMGGWPMDALVTIGNGGLTTLRDLPQYFAAYPHRRGEQP